MDFELSDEQQLIRRTAREFSDREVAPRAAQNARDKHFDLDLVARIAGQGYLVLSFDYSGLGESWPRGRSRPRSSNWPGPTIRCSCSTPSPRPMR